MPKSRIAVEKVPTKKNLMAASLDDFRIHNVPARVAARGDLWKALLSPRGRTDLTAFLETLAASRTRG